MPANLERIRVSGFKSIRELDLQLRPLNVLVGANGSGKSNFISVFHLLNQILQERLQRYSMVEGANNLLHYGAEASEKIHLEVQFNDYEYIATLIPTNQNTLVLDFEGVNPIQPDNQHFTLGTINGEPRRETYLRSPEFNSDGRKQRAKEMVKRLEAIRVYHFQDTSRNAALYGQQNLHDNLYLHSDASNLAPFLYLLQEKHPHEYDRIVRTVKRVAPYFHDFVLRPNPQNEEAIRLEWLDVNSDRVLNPHTLSDGTLRFICLATLLMQPEEYLPSVILIDEPELGLHPFATSLLAGMLRSISTKTQVILATQSVQFVNQFAPEDIIVVERKDGASTFRRIGEEELKGWIENFEDYGVGDLWEKNVFGGNPQPERI